jgi:hypothetical protein
MCILTWGDATNYGDALPIPCSLFDETLPSFIDKKKPIEKGKERNKRGGPTFKKMIALESAKSHTKGAKESNKPYVLNLSLVMRSKSNKEMGAKLEKIPSLEEISCNDNGLFQD